MSPLLHVLLALSVATTRRDDSALPVLRGTLRVLARDPATGQRVRRAILRALTETKPQEGRTT